MSLYNDLGIGKNATAEEIKKAHRDLSKKHHPDAGGNEEDFKRIQHAYDILGDKEKRAYYDTTGHDLKGEDSFERKFSDLVQRIILPMLMGARDYANMDVIKAIKDVLQRADAKIKSNTRKYEMDGRELTNLKESRKRMKVKGDGQHLLLQMLDNSIKSMESERAAQRQFWQEEQLFNDKAVEELDQYEYEYTERKGVTIRTGPGHTGAFTFNT